MINPKIIALIAISILVFGLFLVVLPANAQVDSVTYIREDGSIDGSESLQLLEGTYKLTANISGGIVIQKSGIVIDGAGFTIKGSGIEKGVSISNNLDSQINGINIKNLVISSFAQGIDLSNSNNNTLFGNKILKCDTGIVISGGTRNIITYNTIEDNIDGISIFYSNDLNVISHNNMINNGIFILQSSNQVIESNYWNDYKQKYPEAQEIGSSGKWETPYQYGTLSGQFDNTPIVEPIDIVEINMPNSTMPIVTTSPSSKIPIGIPSDASAEQIILGYLLAAALFIVTSLAVIGLLALILRKKRKNLPIKQK